jgi:hypothetical protein
MLTVLMVRSVFAAGLAAIVVVVAVLIAVFAR